MNNSLNINYFKNKLEEEKARLERELGSVGRVNPGNPADWEATPEEAIVGVADKNEAADRIEAYEERTAVEATLEEQFKSVKSALERIEDGTYGQCLIGGTPHPIEDARLDANPAATTCIKHING